LQGQLLTSLFCLIQSKTAVTGAKPDGSCPVQDNENKKEVTPTKVSLPLMSVVQGPEKLTAKTTDLKKPL
jgi:hypothetical protein